jgi:hypothetical protein
MDRMNCPRLLWHPRGSPLYRGENPQYLNVQKLRLKNKNQAVFVPELVLSNSGIISQKSAKVKIIGCIPI